MYIDNFINVREFTNLDNKKIFKLVFIFSLHVKIKDVREDILFFSPSFEQKRRIKR